MVVAAILVVVERVVKGMRPGYVYVLMVGYLVEPCVVH